MVSVVKQCCTATHLLLDQSVLLLDVALQSHDGNCVRNNVHAQLTAEIGAVNLDRDDAPCAGAQAYGACRNGSA